MTDSVKLKVGGLAFEGWTSIGVTRSLEQAAASFELELVTRFQGEPNPVRIRPSTACELWAGDDRLVTGYIDAISISYSATEHSTTVSGRSKTADLIDSSCVAKPGRWSKLKIEQIAAALAAPFGVEVVALTSTGPAVDRHRIHPGETVFESIDRLAAHAALLVTDDPAGRLVLTRVGSRKATTAIVLGDNVLSAAGKVDASGVFSEYIVKGQRSGNDNDFGAVVAQVIGSASDPDVARKRTLIVHAEKHCTTAGAKARAQWEAANRAGRSIDAEYTIPGWRQADGSLWAPNMLIEVRDPWLALEGEMLIVEVAYSLDAAAGMTCKLKVAPACGYQEKPISKGKSRAVSGLWREIAGGVTVRGVGPTAAQKRAVATPAAAPESDGDE